MVGRLTYHSANSLQWPAELKRITKSSYNRHVAILAYAPAETGSAAHAVLGCPDMTIN